MYPHAILSVRISCVSGFPVIVALRARVHNLTQAHTYTRTLNVLQYSKQCFFFFF